MRQRPLPSAPFFPIRYQTGDVPLGSLLAASRDASLGPDRRSGRALSHSEILTTSRDSPMQWCAFTVCATKWRR
jgi:hypothetical protein